MKGIDDKTTLATKRLTVRPIRAEDWPTVCAVRRGFDRSEYRCYDKPRDTADDAERARVVRRAEATRSGEEHLFFSPCLDGEAIGYISLNVCEGGYELGYGFLPEYRGRGYARESIAAVLCHLKERGVRKVFAGTALQNVPSVRLLGALGFTLVSRETLSFRKDKEGRDVFFTGGQYEKEL